jgi:hypothetical protein
VAGKVGSCLAADTAEAAAANADCTTPAFASLTTQRAMPIATTRRARDHTTKASFSSIGDCMEVRNYCFGVCEY